MQAGTTFCSSHMLTCIMWQRLLVVILVWRDCCIFIPIMHGFTISFWAQPRFEDKWHAHAWQSVPFRHHEVSWAGTSASLGQCSKSHGTWAPVGFIHSRRIFLRSVFPMQFSSLWIWTATAVFSAAFGSSELRLCLCEERRTPARTIWKTVSPHHWPLVTISARSEVLLNLLRENCLFCI